MFGGGDLEGDWTLRVNPWWNHSLVALSGGDGNLGGGAPLNGVDPSSMSLGTLSCSWPLPFCLVAATRWTDLLQCPTAMMFRLKDGTAEYGLKPLKPWAKINLFSSKLIFSGSWSQQQKAYWHTIHFSKLLCTKFIYSNSSKSLSSHLVLVSILRALLQIIWQFVISFLHICLPLLNKFASLCRSESDMS